MDKIELTIPTLDEVLENRILWLKITKVLPSTKYSDCTIRIPTVLSERITIKGPEGEHGGFYNTKTGEYLGKVIKRTINIQNADFKLKDEEIEWRED